jgi:hypothetical protein
MARSLDPLPALVASLALIALVPATAAAQPRSRPLAPSGTQLTLGVDAGITRATLTFDGSKDLVEPLTGGMAGVWIGVRPSRHFDIVADVDYVARGTHEQDGPGVERLHYLDIPVVARGTLVSFNQGRTHVLLLGGISFAIKLGATRDGSDVSDTGESSSSIYTSSDIGAVVGAMVEHGRLGGGIRATWGLTDILADFPIAGQFKNRTLAFLATYRIK